MNKSLNDLFWHDGNLIDVTFSIGNKGRSVVQITALFYKDEQAPSRDVYQIKCEDVLRFNSMLDVTGLKDNLFAGNISNGYMKDNTLWIYFTDGLLEIHASEFHITSVSEDRF